MFQCVTVVNVDPAKEAEVIEAAKALAKETRVQEGNVSYNVVKPFDTEGKPVEGKLVITERWETFENFLGHVAHSEEEGDPLYAFAQVVNPAAIGAPEVYAGPAVV